MSEWQRGRFFCVWRSGRVQFFWMENKKSMLIFKSNGSTLQKLSVRNFGCTYEKIKRNCNFLMKRKKGVVRKYETFNLIQCVVTESNNHFFKNRFHASKWFMMVWRISFNFKLDNYIFYASILLYAYICIIYNVTVLKNFNLNFF